MTDLNLFREGNCVRYKGPLKQEPTISTITNIELIGNGPIISLKMSSETDGQPVSAYLNQITPITLNEHVLNKIGFISIEIDNQLTFQFQQVTIYKISTWPNGDMIPRPIAYMSDKGIIYDGGHYTAYDETIIFPVQELPNKMKPVGSINALQNYFLDMYQFDPFRERIDQMIGEPASELTGRY